MASPFTYGNPITDPSRFFGRDREIEQVLARLRNAEFESTSLVGDRRIGKTSMLLHLVDEGVRLGHGFNPETLVFVYEDLQMIESSVTPVRFWRRLLRRIARQCVHPEAGRSVLAASAEEAIDTFVLDDAFDALDDYGQRIVLLLDEFEHVTQNPNFGPDFFYALRSMAIHHGLALVTSSRRDLIELCHSETIRSSPFFNIFAQVPVRPLPMGDALAFIQASLEPTPVRFADADLRLVFDLAGTHPFFLQMACHFLFETYAGGQLADSRGALVRARFRDETAPHFADAWNNCDDQEKIALTAIALMAGDGDAAARFDAARLQAVYERAGSTLIRLERRGLLKRDEDLYALFSSELGHWITGELTAALSEQRAYQDWLNENGSALATVSSRLKGELGAVLPRIGARYRELIISWVSDPRSAATVIALLKGALG